jgi:hypothetical protein
MGVCVDMALRIMVLISDDGPLRAARHSAM